MHHLASPHVVDMCTPHFYVILRNAFGILKQDIIHSIDEGEMQNRLNLM